MAEPVKGERTDWVYGGHCPGCGERVDLVLGYYPESIAEMAQEGLIVIRTEGPAELFECFCPPDQPPAAAPTGEGDKA